MKEHEQDDQSRPAHFSIEQWQSIRPEDRQRIIEFERAFAEYKAPSWCDSLVGLALLHDEDANAALELLNAANIRHGGEGGHGMFWVDVAADDYQRALQILRASPRIAARFVERRNKNRDECLEELFRIPRRRGS